MLANMNEEIKVALMSCIKKSMIVIGLASGIIVALLLAVFSVLYSLISIASLMLYGFGNPISFILIMMIGFLLISILFTNKENSQSISKKNCYLLVGSNTIIIFLLTSLLLAVAVFLGHVKVISESSSWFYNSIQYTLSIVFLGSLFSVLLYSNDIKESEDTDD